MLYRSSGEPFSGTDLHVLASVAHRLRIAAEDRERAVAIECLAQSGHLLAPHLDSAALMDAAAELMQQLTMSDDAWIVGDRGRRGVPARPPRHRRRTTPRTNGRPAGRASCARGRARCAGEPWTATARPWSGSVPRTHAVHPGTARRRRRSCCCTRPANRPRPFGAEVTEIATIFAS